ncbi:MAG: LamB/YcsF family protein [Pseudomonadota bacterium]|nr:LamB/YcsF family protein [Pseudomonadota bacterium]
MHVSPNVSLNLDVGELPDEPDSLVGAADRVNVACGGHAGDDHTMRTTLERAREAGTKAGAHPSFPDRAGFGRVAMDLPPAQLAVEVRDQCARLAAHAHAVGIALEHVKPHGALYHRAAADPAVASALLDGALEALGPVAVVGPPSGALRDEAARRGLPYLREGFADRGMAPDGSLIPRGAPGALIDDPVAAAAQALRLAATGDYDTLCVHGDGPNALAVAEAVRVVLGGRA